MFLGRWELDDLVSFTVNTHDPTTGAETDADAPPGYRVYEDETGTPILTGTMALLDDGNTVGQYSEQIMLSAANGFEVGKSYSIRVRAVVGGTAGVTLRSFQVEAAAATNAGVADAVWQKDLATPQAENSAGEFQQKSGTLTAAERDAAADALLDRVAGVETGWTVRQVLRVMGAMLGGLISGAATSTATARNLADTKNRVVWTTDSSGNRTSVTFDLSD